MYRSPTIGWKTRSGRLLSERSNWLFAGSLRAGKRAAAIMSLLHSARINGHDPYAYLKDVLERLPTHKDNQHPGTAAAPLEVACLSIGSGSAPASR